MKTPESCNRNRPPRLKVLQRLLVAQYPVTSVLQLVVDLKEKTLYALRLVKNALTTITMKSASECGRVAVIIIVINKHRLVPQKESEAGE